MNQARSPALPSFSGLSSAVNEARDYENNKGVIGRNNNSSERQQGNISGGNRRNRQTSAPSASETSPDGFERNTSAGLLGKTSFSHASSPSSPTVLLQDTLTPLLEEVDALFEKSKQIVASLKAQGNRMQEEDVSTRTRTCCRIDTACSTLTLLSCHRQSHQYACTDQPQARLAVAVGVYVAAGLGRYS